MPTMKLANALTPFRLCLLSSVALTGCPGDDVPTVTGGDTDATGGTSSATEPSTVSDTTPVTTNAMTSGVDTGTDGSTGADESTGGRDSTGGTPTCGDGVVDDGEDCDDAGESATCNDDCTAAACGDGVTNAAAGEACDDAGRSATCNADCTSAGCGDGVVNAAAGETCDDGGESAACNDDCTAASCGDGVVNATAGETCDDGGETAACNVDCTAAACGDGIFNATSGEECDDAGRSAACNVDCTNASCGDGVTNMTAGEACDDAGESAVCNSDCSVASCGDGVTNVSAGEACDDAGESLMCDVDCTAAACGDGLINGTAGEACDDAGESAVCNADCSVAACGDGITNGTAGEACDDGGESAACNIDCTPAMCGDGILNVTAGETCDDGGTGTECLPGCVPCPQPTLFEEDFSDNSAGWTLGAEWQIGPAVASPSPGACGNGDPGSDHTPTADNGLAGVVIGGNAGTALHPFYYLTSPVIDGTGAETLNLWRWLNSDYTPFMQNNIEVWDGAAWQVVWQSGPFPNIEDAAWTEQTYDISAYANPAMQVRIGFNIDSGGVYTCSGWNVDDITITGAPNCAPSGCSGGSNLISTSPSNDMVLCDDPTDTTCEEDFETLCPVGWGLCTQPQLTNRNTGWNQPVGGGASAALGEIMCRGGGGAGHYSVGPYDGITNLQDDAPLNCGYGSSRAACPSGFGCNETTARALCCAPTPTCGNGVVDSIEEQCDDANADESDDCLNSCVWRVPTAHGLDGAGC
jgi:hypothetical protein